MNDSGEHNLSILSIICAMWMTFMGFGDKIRGGTIPRGVFWTAIVLWCMFAVTTCR